MGPLEIVIGLIVLAIIIAPILLVIRIVQARAERRRRP
jgi:hypothetical protein